MIRARRCPFCGSGNGSVKTVWKSWFFYACECKAGGPPRKSEELAIAAWNQRADLTLPEDAAVTQPSLFGDA